MLFDGAELGSLIVNESLSKSELTAGGGLTEAQRSMCEAIGSAIAETQNIWQTSASVTGIIVNGGICSVGGPLAVGMGIGSPGCIVGRVSGTASACKSRFPTSAMYSQTDAMRSYANGIGQGFEDAYNDFLDSATISNLLVNGGTCTCQIILGVPIPGTYFGGIGILSSLSAGVSGTLVTSSIFKGLLQSYLDSNILAVGIPTEALTASMDAITTAVGNYFDTWMSSTSIQGVMVNGGITIPFGPIAAASGVGGSFV